MLRNILRVVGVTAAACLSAATASASTQKIGENLYAYISSSDSSSNSVFLVGESGILVVDTGVNAEEGGKLLAEIRKVSPLPVRWIVNTHYHPDHRAGNAAVGPDAVIISSSFTREKVLAGAPKGGQDYSLNEIADKSGTTLYLKGHPVRIYAPGPAHTRGDLLVYFPDQHAIATGDLFLNNSCPYMDDGDLENWVRALDEILALPIEHAVPGHFAVAGKAELGHFRDYLADLQKQVARLRGEGLSLKQVQRGLRLDAFRDLRQFPQFEATFADNAAAYFRQLEARDRRRSSANK
jgi:cyclase